MWPTVPAGRRQQELNTAQTLEALHSPSWASLLRGGCRSLGRCRRLGGCRVRTAVCSSRHLALGSLGLGHPIAIGASLAGVFVLHGTACWRPFCRRALVLRGCAKGEACDSRCDGPDEQAFSECISH